MAKKHYEKIVIGNGGMIGKCQTCKALTGLRFVTETRNMAPADPHNWQDVYTYKLCDACSDVEKRIYAAGGAEVVDGREQVKENQV